MRRPDDGVRASLVTWLETELDRAAADRPPVGRPMTAHRLNRAEYRNAVRDLIGLDVDIDELLPPDDADAEGFDNNARGAVGLDDPDGAVPDGGRGASASSPSATPT